MRILHLSWVAFFLTFAIWFNLAPLIQAIRGSLGLDAAQISTLLVLNVALTIPARIVIGLLTDLYGPRRVYAALLILAGLPCFAFAFAQTFAQAALARFALGLIGAGFVVGIRMVSEWFPARELGTAEGIYGGWGNFGSAVAAFCLPGLALWIGGEDGWRWAIAATGALGMVYGGVYFLLARDVPEGGRYLRPRTPGGMEVTSKGDLAFLLAMKGPLYLALAALAWRLKGVALLTPGGLGAVWVGLGLLYLCDAGLTLRANARLFRAPVPVAQRYSFRQVAILNLLYFATFGSELAVVSVLPLFFAETFGLSAVAAGMLASAYAFMNLMSRPGGGWISDRKGRRATLLVLTGGLALGYGAMALIGPGWPVWMAVLVAMACSFFVQAGEGAVFAVVPLIRRSLTGQIAGMTGAYGNAGAVFYLLLYGVVGAQTFFLVIAGTAVLGLVALLFLREPAGEITEMTGDGRLIRIPVGLPQA
ncbi:NarK family nitrate/nitrite MFS transporter [Pseudooceanicola sp. CBS1P-1]|uniref:Nitrate/nitrite transporter n=1 Tax=Pseudooceanicola albus TaxID=2692189 RepID=A0A6L7G8Q9_9RHOB|nr:MULTISPECIES: NarK family nitrate/nitrite MFS transporter [Pseudooceanicola]MBT9386300.1 NarK family nitrate/nitrite MFS transporter [Pseudooceanicola endophyticus]MXN20349.1 NarK family nitrate/nitrite MFS transporter [Pseudooceanicola albus]